MLSMAKIGTENSRSIPIAYRMGLRAIEVCLLIFLVYAIATWWLVPNDLQKPVSEAYATSFGTPNNDNQAPSSSGLADLVAAYDPFFPGISPISQSTAVAAPESTLDISVYGTRVRGDGQGSAILKTQGGLQIPVKTGGKISETIKLTGVYSDRIEIRRAGKLESVYLEGRRPQPAAQIATLPAISSSNSESKRALVDQFVTTADLSPLRRNNRIEGFIVGNGAPLPFLLLSGLKKGDLIRSVNGEELHSWERVHELAEDFENSGALDLSLERDGIDLSLNIDLSRFPIS